MSLQTEIALSTAFPEIQDRRSLPMSRVISRFSRIANNDTARFSGITFVCLYYYLVYQSVVLDDAFIYFRVADNFMEMGKPVFNIGDSQFVATSPLWILFLVAGKMILPFFTLELIAKLWWGILLAGASAFAYSAFRPFVGRWAVFASCPFFLSPVISSMTGNEIALLYLAMFGLIWACAVRKPIYSGLFLGIGYLARGEFVLAVIPLFLYFILNEKKQGVESKQIIFDILKISATALVIVLPWHGYYFLTFHSFFPTTFSIKMLQGQSGQWLLFHQAIAYSLYQVWGERIYLIPLAAIGAWRQPYLFRFMALYTFFHSALYAVLKIPYYHWYYYDYYIFALTLTLFGTFSLVEAGSHFMAKLVQSGREKKYRWISIFVFLSVFALIFPLRLELFLPSHFSDIYQNNGMDKRYNSYMEISDQLLEEIRPGDIVLAGEVGITSYVLQGYEVRDINGLASPNVTLLNMNDWDYFVDYYKPRYIIYREDDQDEIRYYGFNNSEYMYKQYFFIPETKTHAMTGVYIRVDP